MMAKKSRTGSWNAWLETFAIGERRYIESSLEGYPHDMRVANTPKTRRPPSLVDRDFRTTLYTAIGAGASGDVRYLVCVERVR